MPMGRASMGLDLNVTGNARSEVKGLTKDLDRLNKNTNVTLGGGGSMRGATPGRRGAVQGRNIVPDRSTAQGRRGTIQNRDIPPDRNTAQGFLQQLVSQREEKKLFDSKKTLQQKEVRQFTVEQRYDRDEHTRTMRRMSMVSQFAQFPMAPTAPMAMMQRAGFGMMQKGQQFREMRAGRITELMQGGKTRQQAEAAVKVDPAMMGMAAKAAMAAGPVGIAAAIAATVLIGSYKGSQMSRDVVKPYVGGLARQATYGPDAARHIISGATRDVAGFGGEGVAQYMSGLQRFHYKSANVKNVRMSAEDVTSEGVSGLGRVSRAMGLDVSTAMSFQNLLTQSGEMEKAAYAVQGGVRFRRAEGGKGILAGKYRTRVQKDVMARLNARFAGNMGMAMQQVTQVGQAEMAATGRAEVTDIANMAAMFGSRNVGQIAPVVTQMSGALRGAAGTGTAREQFFMRAFGGNYQNAIQAMEGGMNVEKYRKIKEQLGKEGYSGFGMHMRMKQLGLFQTTLAAQNYEQGFNKKKAGDLDKQKRDIDKRQERFEGGIGGYGKFAASIQADVINAGLIVTQGKEALVNRILPTAEIEGRIYKEAGKGGGNIAEVAIKKAKASWYITRAQAIAGGAETGGFKSLTAETPREYAMMVAILKKIATLIGTKEGEKKIEVYLGAAKVKASKMRKRYEAKK